MQPSSSEQNKEYSLKEIRLLYDFALTSGERSSIRQERYRDIDSGHRDKLRQRTMGYLKEKMDQTDIDAKLKQIKSLSFIVQKRIPNQIGNIIVGVLGSIVGGGYGAIVGIFPAGLIILSGLFAEMPYHFPLLYAVLRPFVIGPLVGVGAYFYVVLDNVAHVTAKLDLEFGYTLLHYAHEMEMLGEQLKTEFALR